jgi:hypothetical protein
MNSLLPEDTMISGAFLGAAAGFALASRNIPIDQQDTVRQKIFRYLAGLASTGIVYFALKFASNPLNALSNNSQAQLIHFVRYAIVGGWVSYGAPFIFLKLGLATREARKRKSDQTHRCAYLPSHFSRELIILYLQR